MVENKIGNGCLKDQMACLYAVAKNAQEHANEKYKRMPLGRVVLVWLDDWTHNWANKDGEQLGGYIVQLQQVL